jgi:hypothetical protein
MMAQDDLFVVGIGVPNSQVVTDLVAELEPSTKRLARLALSTTPPCWRRESRAHGVATADRSK